MTTVRLPDALQGSDDAEAVRLLHRYYDPPADSAHGFTGSLFDTWDSTGTREADADRFTADDLVAVSLLNVDIGSRAAVMLLETRANEFSAMLAAVGPDRDLADEEHRFADPGPEWTLSEALNDLPAVGLTRASKLFARKRPRLRPIYDSVVTEVTGTRREQWEPFRAALREDNQALHYRLLDLREAAGLSEAVSALRVLDVVCWMSGRGW